MTGNSNSSVDMTKGILGYIELSKEEYVNVKKLLKGSSAQSKVEKNCRALEEALLAGNVELNYIVQIIIDCQKYLDSGINPAPSLCNTKTGILPHEYLIYHMGELQHSPLLKSRLERYKEIKALESRDKEGLGRVYPEYGLQVSVKLKGQLVVVEDESWVQVFNRNIHIGTIDKDKGISRWSNKATPGIKDKVHAILLGEACISNSSGILQDEEEGDLYEDF